MNNVTAMTDETAGATDPAGRDDMASGGQAARFEGGDRASSGDETLLGADSSPPRIVAYGQWPSPISAADIASGPARLSLPTVVGTSIWWQEGRPAEGGRTTIVRCDADGTLTELLPPPWNARSRVHEYGGRSYLPVPARTGGLGGSSPQGNTVDDTLPILFANADDQRLYLADSRVANGTGEPTPLTPDPTTIVGPATPRDGNSDTAGDDAGQATMLEAKALRYADFVLSPDRREIWCVREMHQHRKVTRAIVAVPLDGSGSTDPGAIRELVTGFDFFAFPTPSPDGRWLAWISWNHPRMPWDGTELRIAPMADGVAGKSRLIKGSNRESVLAPLWRDNTSLYVVTDWSGWWNIYQVGIRGEPPQALYPVDEEFAGPLWQLGARPFVLLGDGRLAVLHGRGGGRLGLLDPETSELTDMAVPFTVFQDGLSADGMTIAGIGGAPRDPSSVVGIDAVYGNFTVLRSEAASLPDRAYLPLPQHVELEGPYGRVVHALIYAPSNPAVIGPPEAAPPYIVWVHGGPTAHVTERLHLEKAYFTSRGIGIIDVNYGGSTGYGRLYRSRLNREWGVVDVEDAKAAAKVLARQGIADGAKLGIRGASAGGWTALAAVTTGAVTDPVFSAAVSYYGVSDLRGFAEQTHDFESRYLDGLIGPLPGYDTVYLERAPVGHVNAHTCPVLLLQGLDDPIVPPEQAKSIAADLAAHGIRHAYLAFHGEAHGFRKADTITATLEAELSFYGQIFGFTPPGVPVLKLSG
jgi:dipeptidyl aminopeptidase/acylaminoacyl peptidase